MMTERRPSTLPLKPADPDVGTPMRRKTTAGPELLWKEDWPAARRALRRWWEGRGLALHATAPKEKAWKEIPRPPDTSPERARLDIDARLHAEAYRLSRTFFGGVAAPMFNANIGGPGSLGLFLGAGGHITPETVWYSPCIRDPESHPRLHFDPQNLWQRRHAAMIRAAREQGHGRWLVAAPDLVENLDTLAQLRGTEPVLMDLLERPEWVSRRIDEINRAYFDCFNRLWPLIRDPWGGGAFHAFQLWGPGKTAKVQCDFCCMISPAMFRRFVLPALSEQCAWLDYAMFHLDGTQAIPQLDNLLSIESLRAIEWTPQAGLPGGGSPRWYDLYRRIRRAGKSVQAIDVRPEEVEPLIDAVGPEGLFIMTRTGTEAEAHDLLDRVGWQRALESEAETQ